MSENSSSLKLECEKLASEKMEIQRHYVMVIINGCMNSTLFIAFL